MHMLPERVRPCPPRNPLRRLSAELILIVLAKIAFLSLIGWYVSAHYPRADTRPAAVERLLAPSSSTTPETKP
ncbi:hypothetical protein ACFONN_11400 [Dyella humi]|uniref:Uncharacterized protein n=1 Tax=Dyella humi TaxID=1770547 RepID=A0ABW8ILD6_9GAMM